MRSLFVFEGGVVECRVGRLLEVQVDVVGQIRHFFDRLSGCRYLGVAARRARLIVDVDDGLVRRVGSRVGRPR